MDVQQLTERSLGDIKFCFISLYTVSLPHIRWVKILALEFRKNRNLL